MERTRKSKVKPTLDAILFSTAEQKLLRFLLSEPTTTFSPRVLSSKLKGVRGLGGAEGIQKILKQLEEVGVVQFVNNGREVRLHNESFQVQLMKTIASVCDLEGLCSQLEPLSSKGILYGSRADGSADSDSEYDLLVVTEEAEEVRRIVSKHPLGRRVELTPLPMDDYLLVKKNRPGLATQLNQGIVMWGANL